MLSTKKSLCKINSVDGKDYYMVTILKEGGEEGMQVALCDGDNAWSGTVSGDDLNKMAKKIKMKFPEYLSQTAKALTRENVGSLNFLYQVKDTGDEAVDLIWKKHMASENIKFQLGSLSLTRRVDPSDVVRMIFEHAIKSSETLQEKITSLRSDNERLATERATAIKRLEKCVAAKEEIENDLYGKFVTVLNDKKAKIRSLRDQAENASGSSSYATKASTSTAAAAAAAAGNSDSDETGDEQTRGRNDSDSEYNTDEDTKPSSKRRAIAVKKELSESIGETSLLLDGSLDESDDVPVATKRRRRGGAAAKKATPSKPVLPKVTSGEGKTRTPRQSSRAASLKKSTSNASSKSNRSSDNIDQDELFDDF